MSSMTLKLPNSYVEVERDEMEYVDGGVRVKNIERSIDKRLISYPVNAIGWYFTGGAIGKGLGVLSAKISQAIAGSLSAEGIGYVVSGFTGNWWNFGDHLADYIDSIDIHPNNGRIDYYDTIMY